MLSELYIRDFAIIDELRLQFSFGFNVLTGETGAGKSIILDSLGLILGERADTSMVRAGCDRALVEATFELTPALQQLLSPLLAEQGLEPEEGAEDVLLLAREIRSNGRSLCRLNGATITLGIMREVGDHLVDIHGQGEHLSLLRPRAHRPLLDAFAGLQEEVLALSHEVGTLRAVQRELAALRRDADRVAQRIDYLTFQVTEIEAANLSPDEEDGLREERARLANMEQLMRGASEAIVLLDGREDESPALTDLLGQLEQVASDLAGLDAGMSDWLEQLQNLVYAMTDLARDIRRYREALEYDPDRLAFLEERLELIHRFRRKYSRDVIDILTYADEARRELADISHSDEKIRRLARRETEALALIGELAVALSAKRQAAADRLAAEIVAELADLRMPEVRFAVDFQRAQDEAGVPVGEERLAFDESGIDRIEFLISANPGEPLRPLARVASGGETARIMLALKTALARGDNTPTLIFDEIDQGIGGRVGDIVGRKLWGLARLGSHQVIVVTHLPQLAGYADVHFQVAKEVKEGRTRTLVHNLDGPGRVEELAAMLGTVGPNAARGAEAILRQASAVKHAA